MKSKLPIIAIGVMTGTSVDGADFSALRLTESKNKTIEKHLFNFSYNFPTKLQKKILIAQTGSINLVELSLLTREYSNWLAHCAESFLSKFKINRSRTVFCVHGQTLWHVPRKYSVQIFDPSFLSLKTKCSVIYDFRKSDIANNGEGAPLVPLYHWLRAKDYFNLSEFPLAIHNIGGISNLTIVDLKKEKLLAFDTGPGNCLINLASYQYFKKQFDFNGNIAKSAARYIDWKKILTLSNESYFKKIPPKSTGREIFNINFIKKFKSAHEILVAETTAFTAFTIAKSYSDFVFKKNINLKTIYLAGGGAKNNFLVELIQRCLSDIFNININVKILPKDFAPINHLESIAFARLGYEVLKNRPITLKNTTGADSHSSGAAIFTGENFLKLF